MKHAGKILVLLMGASFFWLAQFATGFSQFLGYLWGSLLMLTLVLNWNRATKD